MNAHETEIHESAKRMRTRRLRELAGHDELAVESADTFAALELLGALASDVDAWRLSASERDGLLARVHMRCFGPHIDSTLTCASCRQPFDISFDLDDMARRLAADVRLRPDSEGVYLSAQGVRFRLPTGEDEASIAHLRDEEAVAALLARCVLDAPAGFDAAALQDAMADAAPLFDIDIDTACPECGARCAVRFDLQHYFLHSLLQERARLWREVHLLASTYGWRFDDILAMRRSQRRAMANLVEHGRSRP